MPDNKSKTGGGAYIQALTVGAYAGYNTSHDIVVGVSHGASAGVAASFAGDINLSVASSPSRWGKDPLFSSSVSACVSPPTGMPSTVTGALCYDLKNKEYSMQAGLSAGSDIFELGIYAVSKNPLGNALEYSYSPSFLSSYTLSPVEIVNSRLVSIDDFENQNPIPVYYAGTNAIAYYTGYTGDNTGLDSPSEHPHPLGYGGFTSSSPSIDHSAKDDPGYYGGPAYSGYRGQNSPSEMNGKGPGMGAGSSGSSIGGSAQAGSYGSSGSSHNFSHEGGAGSSHQGYHNGYGGGGYSSGGSYGGGKGGGSSGGSYGGGKDHSGKDDPGHGGGPGACDFLPIIAAQRYAATSSTRSF